MILQPARMASSIMFVRNFFNNKLVPSHVGTGVVSIVVYKFSKQGIIDC